MIVCTSAPVYVVCVQCLELSHISLHHMTIVKDVWLAKADEEFQVRSASSVVVLHSVYWGNFILINVKSSLCVITMIIVI